MALARDLAAGETLVLFQPRLLVALGSWDVRGDIDVLRLARDASGALQILIADIKSSTAAKVEHRLQVAFYSEMVAALLAEAGIAADRIDLGILYRGPTDDAPAATASDRERRELERAQARDLLGVEDGLLELVADAEAYRGSVRDLVTGDRSTARRVMDEPFAAIPFHLTYKCDGCLYNEFCMKRSAETDDLSLLPHLTEQDKRALQRNGIATPGDLAALKELRREGRSRSTASSQERTELVPAAGKSALARRLAATWPVGQRLDELIHRARRYRRWKKDAIEALTYIPSKGYGSLPYSDDAQNPNLDPGLHRCPARLPARPDLPARRPGRRQRGWVENAGTAAERRSPERGSAGHPGQRGAPLRRLDRGHAAGDRRAGRLPTRRGRRAPDPPHLL